MFIFNESEYVSFSTEMKNITNFPLFLKKKKEFPFNEKCELNIVIWIEKLCLQIDRGKRIGNCQFLDDARDE